MYRNVVVVVCRMMWAAGTVAAMSSISFPAVSALVSNCTDPAQQGESHGAHPPALRPRLPLVSPE